MAVAEKLIHAISAPYLLEDGSEINTSTSIGISLYPDGGETPDSLTKSADEAMYRAKQNGRNNYQVFTQDMHGEVYERASLESQLRQALKQKQFVLHYQPQLELASNHIIGLEALIRWQHPLRGLVYPGDFIHIAEDSGLIIDIGAWVIDEACRQARAWLDAGEEVPTVAVNISFRQFHQHDLQATVEAALQRHALPGSSLEIELTESVMLREPDKVLEVLQNLRARGVRISIDDFGTGYSSLLYLRQLNIDALKMDRSFVSDITHPQGRAMVKVISDVARVLGLRTIAEGVETEEHVRALRMIGCDEIQGYYFSKPLPPDQVMELLRQHASQQRLYQIN
jgi:EAL domain-containing protein (putative c-di-GMP-specific phosphodiesterase class I)